MTPAPSAPRQFVIAAAVLFTTVLILLIILAPLDEWWAILAPRELAVYRLQNAPPGIDFSGCPFGPAERWQLIRREANAAVLFDSVVTFAGTRAGTLFGLAGLYHLASPRFAILRDSVLSRAPDSLYIRGGRNTDRYLPLRAFLGGALLDSTVALLRRPTPGFEC
jgi:hypothetical protein